MIKVNEKHKNELLKSCIDTEIIALNFQSLQGDLPYEYLLYSLDESARRNDGRLRDNWLKRYQHLDHGGWWCNGIDLGTLQPSEWGCFKPDRPRINQGKPIKYEHPPQAQTGVFALGISQEIFSKISHKTLAEIECLNFWQWVIDNPVPIIITEGAKKAACLLSNELVAIALPGIWSGVKDDVLIPELQILSRTSREWIICFDEDAKWTTQNDIFRASRKLGDYLLRFNESSEISVMEWSTTDGKGIDDVVNLNGQGRLSEIYETRVNFDKYLDENGEVKSLTRPKLLDFLIRNLKTRIAYNEMTTRIEMDGQPLDLNDGLVFRFIEEFNIDCNKNDLYGCLLHVAQRNAYHPVEQYLKKCSELKPIKIDDLATRYFGTSEPIYNYFVQQWLIGAVARGLEPGCKMDFALILQSHNQGIGKSTFFKTLGDKWFDDSFGSNLESTKGLMVLHKSWIQEWSEFDRVANKNEFDKIKGFMSCTNDEFVPPYGRESLPHPRRCVLAGTVNKFEFLRDPTGTRRFLVIPLPDNFRIDNELLRQERDQIWAGAVQAYLEGKKQGINAWVIPQEVEAEISKLNQSFSVSDEWEFLIEEYLEDKEFVSITEILDQVFALDPGKQDRKEQMRVANALTKLQWKKHGVGRDESGKRRQLWTRTPQHPEYDQPDQPILGVDPSQDQSQNPSTSQVSTTTNHQDHSGSTSPSAKVDPEVDPRLIHTSNGHQATVLETADQPDQPFSQTNFFEKSLERRNSVTTQSESVSQNGHSQDGNSEIRALEVGDRVIHEISKKTGKISALRPDRVMCRVIWDDGEESTNLFTRYLARFDSCGDPDVDEEDDCLISQFADHNGG